MKKLLLVMLCSFVAATVQLFAQNIIPNGDFEVANPQNGQTNKPLGWRFNKISSVDLKSGQFNRPDSEGSNVLRLYSTGNQYSYMCTNEAGEENVIMLEEGQTYKLSFFAKGDAKDVIKVQMNYYMGGEKMPEELGEVTLTPEWTEYTFEVPGMTDNAGLRLYFPTDNGFIFLDDVSLVMEKEAEEGVFQYDGLYYELDAENGTATLIPELYDEPYYNEQPAGEFDIPSTIVDDDGMEYSVDSIADNAFANCKEVTEVRLPESVKSIGLTAFENSGLVKMTLPATVTFVDKWAFKGCRNMVEFHFPETMTEVPAGLLWNCEKLTEITIPASVEKFGEDVFNSCSSLKKVICEAVKAPEVIFQTNGGLFFHVNLSECELVVPEGATGYDQYPWTEFGKITTGISQVLTEGGIITVYDLQGKVVYNGTATVDQLPLDKGVYLVRQGSKTVTVIL